MTVIPFPPATDRPKPGKEPPEVSAQILILPVIRIERFPDTAASDLVHDRPAAAGSD